jgi:predicted ATPase
VGKTFWRGVVEAIGGATIDDALLVLEARDLVRRDPSSELSGDVQYTFKHMLIREVAYTTVPRAARRDLHAAVARHVEETIGGAGETLPSILAYHWREAGEPSRAIPYLLAAADAAKQSWAQETVVDLYSKALELADDPDEQRRIRLRRGITLVELAQYPRAAEELTALIPELVGAEKLDALLALGHATLWTERDAETLATALEAHALAAELTDETAVPSALALESQALAMRGAEGDLDRALELGDRALELWVPGTRAEDLRHHLHLHADTTYWVGRYEQSRELSRQTRALARDIHSAESLLRGGGAEALALAGLGRHEEAIAIWDELFVLASELGQNAAVLLNYSALAYRELYDTDEARRRTEESLEIVGSGGFGMPRQFAGSDLLFTDLIAGEIGRAEEAWPRLWAAAAEATAWTTWLIAGRLACARSEIAAATGDIDAALEWATQSIDIARRTKRRKYEARSSTLLGQALAKLGRRDESLSALRRAVAIADDLVGQPGRWSARTGLGAAAYALGDDDTAATAYGEAAALIREFAATLAPDRAARFLATPQVAEILGASR